MFKLPKNIKIYTSLTLLLMLALVVPQSTFASTSSSWLQDIMWGIINATAGTAVGMGGLLLNYAVSDYVVGFGAMYQSSGLGNSINNLWAVIRDIFNLTFIFGLVFIGFKMIFNSDDSGAKKMLGSLVIAALLVNFSLFITKFVIDFSNIAAAQIASAFQAAGGASGATYAVSDSFMALMGLSGLFSLGAPIEQVAGTSTGWTYIFGTLILYLTAAFVFAAGGLLLMIRFVALNFYMVLSPLMFLGFVFPGLSGVSRDYWKGFMSKAFFAPAYLLMLYIANQVLVGMRGASGVGDFSNYMGSAANMQNNFQAVIPYFIMTIGFLVGALIVGQKMGVEGANTAVALGRRASGKARQYATNAATYMPRAGARMGANAAGEWGTKKLNNLQTGKGVAAWVAKRNSIDRAVRGTATAAAGARFGTSGSNKEQRDYSRAIQTRANQTEASNKREAEFEANTLALTDSTKTTAELEQALTDLGKTIRGMSKEEKNNLKLSQLTDQSVATNLSDDDIKNLEASGNFSAADIQKVKDKRKDGYVAIATAGSSLATVTQPPAGSPPGTPPTISYANTGAGVAAVNQRNVIASKGTKEVGNLPTEVFLQPNMYPHITPQMLNERIKNGGFSNDQQATLRAGLETYINGLPLAAPARKSWEKWSDEDTNGIMLGLTII